MINNENPIIEVLIEDYERFEGRSDLKPKTINHFGHIFCPVSLMHLLYLFI